MGSLLAPFASPDRHAAVADLLRRRSSNPADIRRLALAGVEASTIRDVLDLGCGFGLMAEAIAEHSVADARILGVDACRENRDPFLAAAARAGRTARFICRHLESGLPCPDSSFDLIVASYSLYYFPGVLPDIARVLRPTGTFITITHAAGTFRGLCEAAGLAAARSPICVRLEGFNAQNGVGQLRLHFASVERVDYPNTLRFGKRHLGELLDYVRFKLPLLVPEQSAPGRVLDEVRLRLTRRLSTSGAFVMDKHDVIFRCRDPRAH